MARHGDDRPAGRRLQLLAQSGHPGPEVGERRCARTPGRRPARVGRRTAGAAQRGVVAEHDRRLAALAAQPAPDRRDRPGPGPGPGCCARTRPLRRCRRRWAISARRDQRRLPRLLAARSTTSTIGHPARSSTTAGNRTSRATDGVDAGRPSGTATSAAPGAGPAGPLDDHVAGVPRRRRAPPAAPRRARRSRPPRRAPGHGAHAAARAPIDDVDAGGGRAPTPAGTTATRRPRRRQRRIGHRRGPARPTAPPRAPDRAAAATIASNGDTAGGSTSTTVAGRARHETGERSSATPARPPPIAGAAARRTFVGGLAVTQERAQSPGGPPKRRPRGERHERRRRARSTPPRVTGCSRAGATSLSAGSRAITQPRTRRPCSGTRTTVPTARVDRPPGRA